MRRTIISTMCMAVALVLATSCNKIEETDPSSKGDGRTVINGVTEAIGKVTKAYNAYCYEVLWQKNDEIYVTKADGTNDLFVLDEGEDTPKGKFVEKGDKGITGEIEAFYPATLKSDDGYVWPSVQVNNQVAPMYAKQTISGTGSETVSFSSLGAVLQIVLTTSEKDVVLSKIRISDAEKPMSGPFTVDGGKAIISSSDRSGITLNLDDVEIGGAANYFNIAVPAGKYDNLKLDFITNEGGVKTLTSTTMPEILRNSVAKISLCLSGTFKFPVSGITLDKTDMTKNVGNHYSFTATISPKKADNKNVTWTSSNEAVASVSKDGCVDFLNEGDAVITVTTEDGGYSASCNVHVYTPTPPKDALPGLFTVANGKQVYFSKGNLWKTAKRDATGATWSWQFEEHQYNFHSWNFVSDGGAYYHCDMGMFGWGNAPNNEPLIDYGIESVEYTWPADKDPWGATIDDKGTWYTLSVFEWNQVVLNNHRWGCVADVIGLILAPDDFRGELKDSYSVSEWEEAEANSKLVFLPAAGRRRETTISFIDYGFYWSSTPYEAEIHKAEKVSAYNLLIRVQSAGTDLGIGNRCNGYSVRLVSEVKPDSNE